MRRMTDMFAPTPAGLSSLRQPLPQSTTLTSGVVALLRAAITRGELAAGQHLPADEIATQLGISRVPVREALKQLEVEGLITYYPNRGAVVTALSLEDIREIYDIRSMLEVGALCSALPLLTVADLERAEWLLSRYEQTPDHQEWAALDMEFHALLYRLEARPRLQNIIVGLRNHVERYHHIYGIAVQQRQDFEADHRALLAACRQGDAQLAAQTLRQHLEHTANYLLQALAEGKD